MAFISVTCSCVRSNMNVAVMFPPEGKAVLDMEGSDLPTKYTFLKEVQGLNAVSLILKLSPPLKVIVLKLLQEANELLPILFTLLGTVNSSIGMEEKAPSPIVSNSEL